MWQTDRQTDGQTDGIAIAYTCYSYAVARKNQSGFTGARDSEWQWHQLGHMQICTLTQTRNHAGIPLLVFYRHPDALPAAQPTVSKHLFLCSNLCLCLCMMYVCGYWLGDAHADCRACGSIPRSWHVLPARVQISLIKKVFSLWRNARKAFFAKAKVAFAVCWLVFCCVSCNIMNWTLFFTHYAVIFVSLMFWVCKIISVLCSQFTII